MSHSGNYGAKRGNRRIDLHLKVRLDNLSCQPRLLGDPPNRMPRFESPQVLHPTHRKRIFQMMNSTIDCRFSKFVAIVVLLSCSISAQAYSTKSSIYRLITNIKAEQRPGTSVIDIYYDLNATSACNIKVHISRKNKKEGWSPSSESLSGDLNNVSTGSRRKIVWNSSLDHFKPSLLSSEELVFDLSIQEQPTEVEISWGSSGLDLDICGYWSDAPSGKVGYSYSQSTHGLSWQGDNKQYGGSERIIVDPSAIESYDRLKIHFNYFKDAGGPVRVDVRNLANTWSVTSSAERNQQWTPANTSHPSVSLSLDRIIWKSSCTAVLDLSGGSLSTPSVRAVDFSNREVSIQFKIAGVYPAGTRFELYRGTSPSLENGVSLAYWTNLKASDVPYYVDSSFYVAKQGETIGAPLYYWVVATLPDGVDAYRYKQTSKPLQTRRRFGLFMGLDQVNLPTKTNYPESPPYSKWGESARSFESMSKRYGQFFETYCLTGDSFRTNNFTEKIESFSREAQPGDLVLISFVTHGSKSSLLFYDGLYPSSELQKALKAFNSSVAIAVIANACHSEALDSCSWELSYCPINVEWVSSAGKEENSHSDTFMQMLFGYGWSRGYAGHGQLGGTVTLGELVEYAKKMYDGFYENEFDGPSKARIGSHKSILDLFEFQRAAAHPSGSVPGQVTELKAEWDLSESTMSLLFLPPASEGLLFYRKNGSSFVKIGKASAPSNTSSRWRDPHPESINQPEQKYVIRAWNGHGFGPFSKEAPGRRPEEQKPPQVTLSATSLQASEGSPISVQLATLNESLSISSVSGLPGGLSLSSSGILEGVVDEPGSFTVFIQFSDSETGLASIQSFTIDVDGIWISTNSLPSGTAGVSYCASLSASGGMNPLLWSASNLPPGLSVSEDGIISGIPTQSGDYSIAVSVTDVEGMSGERTIECHIGEPLPLRIVNATLPEAGVGWVFETAIEVQGGIPPYIWTFDGLPDGVLSYSDGTITGGLQSDGIFPISISVCDAVGTQIVTNASLVVHTPKQVIDSSVCGYSRFGRGGKTQSIPRTHDVIHTFTENGQFTLTQDKMVRILAVGGGGGGGFDCGGGGGGGGVIETNNCFLSAGTYDVFVGAGGAGGLSLSTPAGTGGSSWIAASNGTIIIKALGGGGGVGWSGSAPTSTGAAPFASGGGGTNRKTGSKAGDVTQGSDGCSSGQNGCPQGGGGAGGTPDQSTVAIVTCRFSGNGGPGRHSNIRGFSESFGPGGGGGAWGYRDTTTGVSLYLSSIPGAGGDNEYGFGMVDPYFPDQQESDRCHGRNGYGGGGGGGNNTSYIGAPGGSGVVIIRLEDVDTEELAPEIAVHGLVSVTPFDANLAASVLFPGSGASNVTMLFQISETEENLASTPFYHAELDSSGYSTIAVHGLQPGNQYFARFCACNDLWHETDSQAFAFTTPKLEERSIVVPTESEYAGLLQYCENETGLDFSFDCSSEGLVRTLGAMAASSGTTGTNFLRVGGWYDCEGTRWNWSPRKRFGYVGWMWMDEGSEYHFVGNMWNSEALAIDDAILFSAIDPIGHGEIASATCHQSGWHKIQIWFGGSTGHSGVRAGHQQGFGWNKDGWSIAFGDCGQAFPVLENQIGEDAFLVTAIPWRSISSLVSSIEEGVPQFEVSLGASAAGNTDVYCVWGNSYGNEDTNSWENIMNIGSYDELPQSIAFSINAVAPHSLVRVFALHEDGTTVWTKTIRLGEDDTSDEQPTSIRVGEVSIPSSWLDEHAWPILAQERWNYQQAATAISGNNKNTVLECYIAGLDPLDPDNEFVTDIKMNGGTPIITWSPDLNEGGRKRERIYTVEGATDLGIVDWGPTNAASRFFRVKVSLP